MFSALPVFLLLLATARCGKDKPVFSEDIQEIIDSVHNDCVGKTGVSEEDIQNCEKGIFKEDEKLKCYMVCLLEEASLVEDDLVDYDMLVSLMPEQMQDRTRTMLYACKHNDSPDKARCQRAFDVHKCSYEKDPDCHGLGVPKSLKGSSLLKGVVSGARRKMNIDDFMDSGLPTCRSVFAKFSVI